MSLIWKRYWMVVLLCCLAMAWSVAPAAETQEQPADEPAAEEPAAEEPDPYAVPEGTPQDLAKFIDGILATPPPDAEARKKAVAAMQEAADKILAGKPDEEAAGAAVRVKTMFAASAEELETLAEQLEKAELPVALRQVRSALISIRLRGALQGSREEVTQKVKEAVEEVKQFLAEGPLQPSDVGLAMNVGRMAEMIGDTELAADAYTSFAKTLAASDDEKIAEMAKRLEGVVRRLTVIGQEMKVEGTLLGGGAFDWADFAKGKVVLVDFWATWCGPCVGEVPNMKKNYEDYHELGFEIVGISLDRSREALEKFIEEREIPWTILYSDDERSPTVDYYGVMGIPTMMLVGTDGKVVSIRARGPQLRAELEKLLGPVEEVEEKVEEEEEKKEE
ncbi:MAG TPA: thioredoxin-like domain-containing protein [Thermoguttaceae bacterium]|nr:thioredoxin-like domain-containing protein [Thermoguttaceae bacterium]